MVLMRVSLPVGEDQVGIDFTLQLFETFFYFGPALGKEAIAKLLEYNFLFMLAGKKFCTLDRLLATWSQVQNFLPARSSALWTASWPRGPNALKTTQ